MEEKQVRYNNYCRKSKREKFLWKQERFANNHYKCVVCGAETERKYCSECSGKLDDLKKLSPILRGFDRIEFFRQAEFIGLRNINDLLIKIRSNETKRKTN